MNPHQHTTHTVHIYTHLKKFAPLTHTHTQTNTQYIHIHFFSIKKIGHSYKLAKENH